MTREELGEDSIYCISSVETLSAIGRVDWITYYNDFALVASGLPIDYFETNCLDAEFERLDHALNETYKSVIKDLSPSKRSELRESQRGWIIKRRKFCNLAKDDEAIYLKSWTCRQIVNYDRLQSLRKLLGRKN